MTDMHNEATPDEPFDDAQVRGGPNNGPAGTDGDDDMHNEWWSGLLSLLRRLLRLGR